MIFSYSYLIWQHRVGILLESPGLKKITHNQEYINWVCSILSCWNLTQDRQLRLAATHAWKTSAYNVFWRFRDSYVVGKNSKLLCSSVRLFFPFYSKVLDCQHDNREYLKKCISMSRLWWALIIVHRPTRHYTNFDTFSRSCQEDFLKPFFKRNNSYLLKVGLQHNRPD